MRIDAIYITLALMVASAIVVLGVLWFGLTLLLAMAEYIEGVTP